MERNGLGGVNLTGIIVAIFILASSLLHKPPLEPDRPAVPPDIPEPLISREDVPARLWEDPFAAVRRTLDQLTVPVREGRDVKIKQDHTTANLHEYLGQLQHSGSGQPGPELTILMAMVPGGPYAENREFRRRVRFAVLSGLSSSGFSPNDELHVGLWRHPGTDGDPAVDIPFEAHVRQDAVVLVLWLADESLLANPLRRLNSIFGSAVRLKDDSQMILVGTERESPPQASRVILRLVGPWRSGTLKVMVEDACKGENGVFRNLKGLKIYAASPTVPDEALLPAGCGQTEQEAAGLLEKELRLRGIDPGCQKARSWPHVPCSPEPGGERHYVVLLSESDTLFGRKLGEALRRAKEEPASEGSAENVLSYRYFRGIDGIIPGVSVKADSTPNKSEELSTIADLGSLEPAEGPGQFDYLRRLADELKYKDRKLRGQGKGRILAFGVLGSDFYDKLLVLQALREKFPNHIYFTTDLDARFLEPKRYRWTRNLIVASGYGLDIPEAGRGKGETPRFRSSYQTSYFLAVRAALSRPDEKLADFCPMPKLFETGRSRFVELSDPSGKECPDSCSSVCFKIPASKMTTSDDRGATDNIYWRPVWLPRLFVVMLLAFMLAFLVVPQMRRMFLRFLPIRLSVACIAVRLGWKRTWLRNLLPVVFLSALLIIVVWGAAGMLYLLSESDEPVVLAAGVSLWPSEIIRLAAGVLSVWLIFLGFRRIRIDDGELQREFGLEQSSDEHTKGKKGLFERFFSYLDWLTYAYVAVPDLSGWVTNGRKVWSRYVEFATARQRVLRIIITGALFYSIAFITIYGFHNQPLLPYRGESAFWVSTIVGLCILGLPFTFLLFSALDETMLSSCLIRHLTRSPTYWNETRERYRAMLPGISNEALDNWITVRFLAARTEMTASVMNYPFMILLLMLLSLSTSFDNWDITASVAGILGLSFLLTGYAMVVLCHAARKGKERILEQIEDQLATQRSQAASSEERRLALLAERIRQLHRGAFRHWYQEPVIKALLWVLGVASLLITQHIGFGF
jgi:hypothetical protein